MLASEDKLQLTTCIKEESEDLVAFQLHVTTPVANLMVSYSPKTHYFFFNPLQTAAIRPSLICKPLGLFFNITAVCSFSGGAVLGQ